MRTLAAPFACALVLLAACHANPSIDGQKVATVGSATSPPTCAEVCSRLQALCGYAPDDCTNADGTGYCDVNFTDDALRTCIGYGTVDDAGATTLTQSCQAAWDCFDNAPATVADDAALSDDAASDDASSDLDGGSD